MSDLFPVIHSTNIKLAEIIKMMRTEATAHDSIATRLREEAGALEDICLGDVEPTKLHSDGLAMSHYAVIASIHVSQDRISETAGTLGLIAALKSELRALEAEAEEPSLFADMTLAPDNGHDPATNIALHPGSEW